MSITPKNYDPQNRDVDGLGKLLHIAFTDGIVHQNSENFADWETIQKNKVNVSMITQGSSELNLAFVVKNSDTNSAVRAIHNAFTLDKIN